MQSWQIIAISMTFGLLAGWLAGCLRTRLLLQQARLQFSLQREELERLSRTDALTGLWNRRGLDEQLPLQFAQVQRYSGPLCVILIDVDRFKSINEAHGHLVGDEVLHQLGTFLRQTVRSADYAARYGGEEFLLLLPHTNLAGAEVLAERLRLRIAEHDWLVLDQKLRITISAGVAVFQFGDQSPSALIARADAALREAKSGGRNLVRTAAPTDQPTPKRT